jgi:hypothetical protein
MTDPKHIDRRSILTSSAGAIAAVFLGGCGDDASDSNRADGSAGPSSDAATSGGPSATAPATGASASSHPSETDAGAGDGGADASAGTDDAGPDGGSDGGRGDSGGVLDGGRPDAGIRDGGSDGGTGEAGAGGEPDSGGTAFCGSVVEIVNGHAHVVNVPLSDVEAGFDTTYVLEDGGAGHTHMLVVSAYDHIYLQGGAAVDITSSTDATHSHVCTLTYVL